MLGTSTMHLERRLLAALCAGSLAASHAQAQPASPATPSVAAPAPIETPPPAPAAPAEASPDALETPYADTPPAPPPRVPVAAPNKPHKIELAVPGGAKPDIRPQLPIRARRKLALLGEIAWNGLAGFGPILTYHAHPHFSADFAVGFSLLGPKVGVRGRYNFLTTPFTPFVGLGYNYGSGFGQFTTDPSSSDPKADPNREPVTIDQGPSYLIQGTVGFDFVHRRGFTMLGTLGYAWLLNKDNYRVLAGKLTHDEEQGFNIAFKGGLVLGVALGYAFETQ